VEASKAFASLLEARSALLQCLSHERHEYQWSRRSMELRCLPSGGFAVLISNASAASRWLLPNRTVPEIR
jgi:hypothetical protein